LKARTSGYLFGPEKARAGILSSEALIFEALHYFQQFGELRFPVRYFQRVLTLMSFSALFFGSFDPVLRRRSIVFNKFSGSFLQNGAFLSHSARLPKGTIGQQPLPHSEIGPSVLEAPFEAYLCPSIFHGQ